MRILIVLLGLAGLGWLMIPDGTAGEKPAGKEKDNTDVTAEMRAMHQAPFAPPPGQFKAGHVKPRQLDPKAVVATAKGFTVQLPSKAPVLTPTVYEGNVYVGGGFHSREFYCFDAQTGKLVWAVDLDDDGPSSAVCAEGVVVFNTESCTIFALDAASGKQLWSYWLGDPLTSTPAIAGGKVFTSYPAMGQANGQRPNASHALACIELKTGKILWQKWIDSDVMSAPVAVDDAVYATSFSGVVYKFQQKDGTLLSAQRSRATSAPVVVGKNIFLTQRADNGKDEPAAERIAGFGGLGLAPTITTPKKEARYLDTRVQEKSELKSAGKALDAANGFAGGAPPAANPEAALANVGQGNVSTMQAFQGSRILSFADANYNCMGNEIVCTNPTSGATLWSVKLTGDLEKQGGFLGSPPAAAGGKIFLATLKGDVLQLNPKDGKTETTYAVGSPLRSQPAIMGGRIYVGTQDGKLVCIDTGNPQFTGWSTWGANAAHTNLIETGK